MIDQEQIRKQFSPAQRRERGTHAGLWLDKYLRNQQREEKGSRQELVDDVADLPVPLAYIPFFTRWQETLKQCGAQTRRVRTRGRMVVGLGSESLLEASISLHRTYGVPYIPGSALKGLAASYAHHFLGGEWGRGEPLHQSVFGDTDNAGYITFFDALYVPDEERRGRPLVPDVITVHHQKYYQGVADIPSENDDPNPVPFLSATGIYLFALAASDVEQQTRWLDITFQILALALEKLGIGAKTSSGYGRMVFVDPPTTPIDPELRLAESVIQGLTAMALRDVAGQIHSYYQKWRDLTSPAARYQLARAIRDKIQWSGRTKQTAENGWYKEIMSFLETYNGQQEGQ